MGGGIRTSDFRFIKRSPQPIDLPPLWTRAFTFFFFSQPWVMGLAKRDLACLSSFSLLLSLKSAVFVLWYFGVIFVL
jgi:hypothetical protein